MQFSIITGTQNNETTIDRAIQSVASQTGVDWELLVINDGSTDQTEAHVQKWVAKDARIKLFNQPASGVSAARNRGLAEAGGDYVLFLDADDWFEPDSFNQLATDLQAAQPDILIFNFLGARSETDQKPSDAFSVKAADWTTPQDVSRIARYAATQYGEMWDVWYGNLHNVWGRCYRTALLKQISAHFDEELAVAEDWKFNLTVFPAAKKVSIRDRYLYNYYDNATSVMHVLAWTGHEAYFKGYRHLAAFLNQTPAGQEYLPYIAIDQLRDEYRLIVQSGMGMISGSRALKTIRQSLDYQWTVGAVSMDRLKANDRKVYAFMQRKLYALVWLVYFYQERIKPGIKTGIRTIIPRRWLPQRLM